MIATNSARHAGDWRLVLGTSADAVSITAARGAVNMAVDDVLLEYVQRTGRPVVRFYTWAPACLSLGRNQRALGVYDAGRAMAAGIDVVRRPTGGLAVLHDRELTYCVLAPLEPLGGARAAYGRINGALVEGLRSFGVPAEQSTGGRARGPLHESAEPCFQAPAAGEVVARGRKLVGSAQRCERGALLQHGSILLSGSQSRVLDLMTERRPHQPRHDGSITLCELLGTDPPLTELAGALGAGFERLFGTRLAPEALSRNEAERVQQLALRYDSSDWTWRR